MHINVDYPAIGVHADPCGSCFATRNIQGYADYIKANVMHINVE